MKYFLYKKNTGFSLLELLTVIAIIGLLASVVLSGLPTARVRSRTAQRITDMRLVQNALELYYANNHSYPYTWSIWRSVCSSWGGFAADFVIPGLTPTYMATIPVDPQTDAAGDKNCYRYRSDGVDYAFSVYDVTELRGSGEPNYATYPEFLDPANQYTSWKVYSPGGLYW